MEQRKKGKGVVKDKFQKPSSKTQVQKAGKIDSGFL
jgi:signal transduction histidine kinase